jgi:hypothetical protein
MDHFEGGQSGRGVGERIARSGDPHHRNAGFPRDSFAKKGHSLSRRKNAAADSGTAFVDTVEFPVAESALHVALWRDGQVDPGGGVSAICVETGMI